MEKKKQGSLTTHWTCNPWWIFHWLLMVYRGFDTTNYLLSWICLWLFFTFYHGKSPCFTTIWESLFYFFPSIKQANPKDLCMVYLLAFAGFFDALTLLLPFGMNYPQWQLTYPTLGKGNSSSKVLWGRDMSWHFLLVKRFACGNRMLERSSM